MMTALKFILALCTGGLSSLLTWGSAIPTKAKLEILGGVLVLVGIMFWNHHERAIGDARTAAKTAALQSQYDLAQAANASAGSAIKALQDKLAECEKGRTVDKAAQDEAQKAYAKAIELFKAGDAAAHARTAKLLQGDCKAWAQQPACGVAVMP